MTPGRRRLLIGLAVAVAAVGLVGWLGASGPRWMMERAWDTHEDCLERMHSGDLSCREEYRAWLRVPLGLPWVRDQASSRVRWAAQREAEPVLEHYSVHELDRAQRRQAARALIYKSRAYGDPAYVIFDKLDKAGAYETIVKHEELAQSTMEVEEALRAAISLGDFGVALELAQRPGSADLPLDWHLVRGAWLCLNERPEEGLKALELHRAAADDRSRLRRALMACGGAPDIADIADVADIADIADIRDPLQGDIEWAEGLLVQRAPMASLERLAPRADSGVRARSLVTPFFVDWLQGGERPAELVVNLAGRVIDADSRLPRNVAIDPQRYLAAADHLARVRENLPPGALPPLDAANPAHARWYGDRLVDRARKEPHAALELAEQIVSLQAAQMLGTLRDRSGFEAALERLSDDTRAANALELALLARDVGASTKADALVASIPEDGQAHQRAQALTFRAELSLSRGDGTSAHEFVEAAEGALKEAEEGFTAPPGTLMRLADELAWVEAAVSLATDGKAVTRVAKLPEYIWQSKGLATEELPQDWFALARADQPTRRQARRALGNWWLVSSRVPAAQLRVIAHVARDGEPDVWLDRLLDMFHPPSVQPYFLRARAAAAEARGDPAMAKLWTARAEKIESLLSEPRDAVLAWMVGIQ